MNPSKLAEEGRINSRVGQKDQRHAHRHLHLHHKRKAKREAAMKRKIEGKLPKAFHGETIEQTQKRLSIKNEAIAALAEFCGTFLFLFFSYGIATIAGQQRITSTTGNATALDASQLQYSALGFGFALAVNAWCFYRVSGGLFNPAVGLGLWLSGAITWYRFLILVPFQFLGGIAGAGIAQLLLPGGINARSLLSGGTSIAQGFFIEMFMTAMLMFAVLMLAAEKHRSTFLAPVGIGLALFIAELFATPFTSGALNPARALGPDVIAAKFEGSCWIFYTAPFVGALVATGLYKILKWSRYESVVEGQDSDNRHMLIRNHEGELAGFVEEVTIETAQPHIDRALEGGVRPPTPGMGGTSGTTLTAVDTEDPPAGFPGVEVGHHVEKQGEPLGDVAEPKRG